MASRAPISPAPSAPATGRPVMAYLRARRLSKAAEALAKGAPDILSLALDAGYSSHEAFTRAFRDQFGATPEAVRERASTRGLELTTAPDLMAGRRSEAPASRLVEEGRIRAVGLSERFPCGPSFGITQLWERFVPFMDAIPNIKPGMPVGISHNFDEEGGFDHIAALEVTRFGDAPSELAQIEIAPRRYAVFTHAGHVTRLPDTYRFIWDEGLAALNVTPADAPTLERHLPAFNPMTGEGGIDVWIPLDA